jgi:hypothetical protein
MRGLPRAVLRDPVRRVRDVSEYVAVLAVATVTEVSLRTTTLPTTARLLRVRLEPTVAAPPADASPARTEPPVLPVAARRQVRAVQTVVGRWPFGDTCLRQSLVLGQRLHRLDPALVVGMRKDTAGTFAAHAWLVVEGRSIDPESRQFAALAGR